MYTRTNCFEQIKKKKNEDEIRFFNFGKINKTIRVFTNFNEENTFAINAA